MGMFRLAVKLASTLTAWTASPVGTDSRKLVSPLGTKVTLALDAPVAASTVPVMAVTPASRSAVSVTLSCPATVWSSTGCSMDAAHSDSTTPLTAPGVQPRVVMRRSQISPSDSGSGYGIRSCSTVSAPAWPMVSSQDTVKDGTGPLRGRE